MGFGKFGGFFVDSCILLPQSIEALKQTCNKFLLENSENCLISSSVKTEGISLLDRSHSIVVKDLQENLKPYLLKQGIKELSNKDGRIFAEFFSNRRREIKKKHKTKSNVPNELLGAIETYVASRLHSLSDGIKIPVDTFLSALIRELSTTKHKLRLPFVSIPCIEIEVDTSLKCLMIAKGKVLNPEDAEHLVSSVTYQFQENKWVIFVSHDDDHILGNNTELSNIFVLQCSKPDWASDYSREMTQRKSPIEYYQELDEYSENQKNFGSHIQKILGINILS